MRTKTVIYLLVSLLFLASCSKESDTPQSIPSLVVQGASEFTFTTASSSVQRLYFRTNVSWNITVPSSASWLKVEPMSGTIEDGDYKAVTVTLTSTQKLDKKTSSKIVINYADKTKEIKVTQLTLSQSSDFDIPDDMIFSTTLNGNTTNVAQGFDYDPDTDMVYVMSKYGTFKNMIGWQKRNNTSSQTKAANIMQLSCFSHGNNVSIQKDGSKTYVWTPNYATRQDDGSYDNPAVVSRLPLQQHGNPGIPNNTTTENYYFGIRPCWPAFDFENDMMAICNYKKFDVYRLSELMALPDEQITLDFNITYGGHTPVETSRDEFSGKPTITAKDCRKVKPLYSVPFTYTSRGLHWQTYCIDNGWIYAILQADKKEAPEIIFDVYVEAYKMDGTKNLYKIRQEYMQNRDRIVSLGWTEKDYFYCEPEGIRVRDGVMYTLYAMRKKPSDSIRWPIIFRLSSPVTE